MRDLALGKIRSAQATTGYVIMLYIRAIGREVWRAQIVQTARPSAWLEEFKNRIAKAQNRAWNLRSARIQNGVPPIPTVVLKNCLNEIFPRAEMSLPEWLAYVAKECGKDYPKEQQRAWVDGDNSDALMEYIEHKKEAKKWTGKTMLKARWFFLLHHWKELNAVGMTAEKAHKLFGKRTSKNKAGDLGAFQKWLNRIGVAFHPSHAPKGPHMKH